MPRLGSLPPKDNILVSSAAKVFWDSLELVSRPDFIFQVDCESGHLILKPDGSSSFFTFIEDKFCYGEKLHSTPFSSEQFSSFERSLEEDRLDKNWEVGDRLSSLFLNSNGNLTSLGTLTFNAVGTKSFRISGDNHHHNIAAAHKGLSGEIIETIEVQETSEEQGITLRSITINKPTLLWDSLLALGINVPLLLCYASIGLDFKVRQTVPLEFIEFNSTSGLPFYKFAESNSTTIAFDLDGTLHASGFPIASSVGWLNRLVSQGHKIIVLTRNLENPREILEHLEILERIHRIVKVSNNRKKSELIGQATLFIDDEFNQRVDVFESAGVPSISVEQLKLLEKR